MQQRLRRDRHAAGVFRIRADLRPLRGGIKETRGEENDRGKEFHWGLMALDPFAAGGSFAARAAVSNVCVRPRISATARRRSSTAAASLRGRCGVGFLQQAEHGAQRLREAAQRFVIRRGGRADLRHRLRPTRRPVREACLRSAVMSSLAIAARSCSRNVANAFAGRFELRDVVVHLLRQRELLLRDRSPDVFTRGSIFTVSGCVYVLPSTVSCDRVRARQHPRRRRRGRGVVRRSAAIGYALREPGAGV